MWPWYFLSLAVGLVVPGSGQVTVGWSYQDGTAATDYCWASAVDPTTHDVLIGAMTYGNLPGNTLAGVSDLVAVKLDKDGVHQWTYQAGEVGSQSEVRGITGSGGNVVIVGRHTGTAFGSAFGASDIVVVMLNSAGAQQWSFSAGTSVNDIAEGVAIDSAGNVVVAGVTLGALGGTFQGGTDDSFILKLNSAGVQQWLRHTEISTSGNDFMKCVAVDSSDNIFAGGTIGAAFDGHAHSGDRDALILKMDTAGTLQWSWVVGTTASEQISGLAVNTLGDVYGAGWTLGSLPGFTGGAKDAILVKLNAAGVQQWLQQIGSSSSVTDIGRAVAVHSATGNVALVGSSAGDAFGTNSGGQDPFVAEYDASGALRWSATYGSSGTAEGF